MTRFSNQANPAQHRVQHLLRRFGALLGRRRRPVAEVEAPPQWPPSPAELARAREGIAALRRALAASSGPPTREGTSARTG